MTNEEKEKELKKLRESIKRQKKWVLNKGRNLEIKLKKEAGHLKVNKTDQSVDFDKEKSTDAK
jgi:hypothetical protein